MTTTTTTTPQHKAARAFAKAVGIAHGLSAAEESAAWRRLIERLGHPTLAIGDSGRARLSFDPARQTGLQVYACDVAAWHDDIGPWEGLSDWALVPLRCER